MTRPELTVTIITYNEEKNLPRALESVRWADEVLVVDSGSTDETVALARASGARVLTNPWPGYGQQKNFAQAQAKYDWVLNIDADEVVSRELRDEILKTLTELGEYRRAAKGFYLPRKTFYLGRWILHGGWYPNYLVRLADRRSARWTEPSVHEELTVEGAVGKLMSPLEHFTFRTIQDQILTNLRFSKLGAEELRKRRQKASILKLLIKPVGKFAETYVVKAGWKDGLPGFIISVNAAHSMFLKYAYLLEPELGKDIKNADSDHRQQSGS